jgi:hypothetical protein
MEAKRQARRIGWVSVGSGLAMLAAPKTAAKSYGLVLRNRTLVRLLGARDVVIGSGILTGNTARWMKLRVAADVTDLTLIAAKVVRGPVRPVVRLLMGMAATVAVFEVTRRL